MADAKDLDSLRPDQHERIMDLVSAAGIDVSPWSIKEDGSPTETPAANPHYCYDWAFGGGTQPTALCVWHRSLKLSGDQIVYEGNLRKEAIALERAMESRLRAAKERNRARSQAKRAQEFDRRLQSAYRRREVVRVITLVGEERGGGRPGLDVSRVELRYLDPESWSVVEYGDNGSFRLVRGARPAAAVDEPPLVAAVPKFIDQFVLPPADEPKASSGISYPRSAEVRSSVLSRAGGTCECCGSVGFITASGAIYLETHHVIPLSEGGPDVEWNVVAVCPNDHRRAHHASDWKEIRQQLLGHLVDTYPSARTALESLVQAPMSSAQ